MYDVYGTRRCEGNGVSGLHRPELRPGGDFPGRRRSLLKVTGEGPGRAHVHDGGNAGVRWHEQRRHRRCHQQPRSRRRRSQASRIRLSIRGILSTAVQIGDAIDAVVSSRRASGHELHVLCDRHGEIYNLETTAADYEATSPFDGPMAHSNHYLADRLKPLEAEGLRPTEDKALHDGAGPRGSCGDLPTRVRTRSNPH